jgi:predicted ribosome quality control (RQC) complex YloA/Tae2 family protein
MFLGTFFFCLTQFYTSYQAQYYLGKFMEVESLPEPFPGHRKQIERKIFEVENALRAARAKLENYDAAAAELREYGTAIEDIMLELGFEIEFDDLEWEPDVDAIKPPGKLARSDNYNGGGLVDSMGDP